MPNIGGLLPARHLMEVANSIMLYGSEILAEVKIQEGGRRDLSRTKGHGLVGNLERLIIMLHRCYRVTEEGKVIEDAEHTILECARWLSYRSVLTSVIGMITAANIVGVMIASRKN